MRRIVKTGIFIGATAAVVISGTLVSYAGWTVPGPATTATVRTPSMPAGTTPGSKMTAAGNALVSWPAQKLGRVKMTAYVVTAHDTDGTPLPPIVRSVTASGSEDESATFTAAELAGGKWKWAIAPKLQSWAGPEGALSNPKLIFPGPTTATALAKAVTAGTSTEVIPAAPPAAPTEMIPTPASTTPASTTRAPAKKPDPAPSVTEKGPAPEKTKSPEADPAPSESSPAPVESAE